MFVCVGGVVRVNTVCYSVYLMANRAGISHRKCLGRTCAGKLVTKVLKKQINADPGLTEHANSTDPVQDLHCLPS